MENQTTARRLVIEHLEMVDIVKRFPGVLANNQVNFDVRSGEIHALLGENGAGKSTLVKQLYGLYRPTEGQILLNGQPQAFHSPVEAINAGIGMVHQHFMLVPSLTVTENVALGLKSTRAPFLDLARVEMRICELSEQYGLKVDPKAYVWQLAVGEQQRVEIIKALYRGADLLILDEPTAVLTPQEVDELFYMLRKMVDIGHSIIFISHKLHEVIAISDRITVLRDGCVVGTRKNDGITKTELASLMVGREVILQYERGEPDLGEVYLDAQEVWVTGDRGVDALQGVSIEVQSGEILAIAGVSGNGQRELAEALAGLRPVERGVIKIGGKEMTTASPARRHAAGLAYIPEERMVDGCIKDFSVQENLILIGHTQDPFARQKIVMDFKAIAREASQLVESYNIKTPSTQTPTKNLSGGNIQKMILAREFYRHPQVIIASQPTRGVDIGATEYIHQRLLEQRSEGAAILLISEDLDEICALSDRIAVIYEGRIIGIIKNQQVSLEQLGLMMAGVESQHEAGTG
jgi:general nucleoside transport system ATP-binding protein